MHKHALMIAMAGTVLTVSACDNTGAGGNKAPAAQTPEAAKAAGTETIAAGLQPNSPFMAAAKGCPGPISPRRTGRPVAAEA